MTKALSYHREDEKGQTMIEHMLILAARIVAIVASPMLGTTIASLVNKIVACL